MITKKLLDFQKLNITVEKDATNPYFNSKYTTLNEVLAKVKKPLNDMGVLILQEPTVNGLLTRLVDTEDESEVTSCMPYGEVSTAQKIGAGVTYGRRYSLVSLLGLEDEDDDGNAASTPVSPKTAPQRAFTPQKVSDPMSTICKHGKAAKRVMSKSAKNPNRWFYSCGEKAKCDYFMWEDEIQTKGKADVDIEFGSDEPIIDHE